MKNFNRYLKPNTQHFFLKKQALIALFSSIFITMSFNAHAQTISSIADLAIAAAASNQRITMEPGTYQMEDYLTQSVINNTNPDGNGRYAMIEFSGNNNTFDFTGVTIEVNTALLDRFGARSIEFYVTGNGVTINGLTVTDIGSDVPASPGMQSMTVAGENNTIENVTFNIRGSSPYGYGDLLGKGGTGLVAMRKHSGLLVEGLNINIIGCSIYSRAFGHLFFIQGGRNVLFQDCYAEAVIRSTDSMLADRSGPAFDLDFEAIYPNYDGDKVITPGYTKSLSEVGFRSYGAGGVEGFTTGRIDIVNCTAKNTRIGFALTQADGPITLTNSIAIDCEAGYNVDGVTMINCSGNSAHGPLLYLNGQTSTVDLSLIPDAAMTTIHALATIAGDNHNVTINKSGGTRPQEHLIRIGATRGTASNPFSPLGTSSTSGITLNNCTEMPVEILSVANSNTINSDSVINDNGSGNTVDEGYDCRARFIPDPNKTYYIDSPHHNLRIAATGESEEAYTTSTNTTGNDVEWKFVDRENGYWHIQRVAGGAKPRLRSDNSENADMSEATRAGSYTYYEFIEGAIANTYFLTLPVGPENYRRLQVDNSGSIRMVEDTRDGTWESFTITEAGSINTNRASAILETETSSKETAENEASINNDDWLRFNDAIIYPNPILSSTTIKGAENSTVVIYNMNGSVVFVKSILNESEQMDLSELTTGIYYAEISNQVHKSVIKLVKE